MADVSSHDTLIDGNDFHGLRLTPTAAGVWDGGSAGTVVTGNKISGASPGIRLAGSSLETAVVTDNVVDGMPFAIVFAS